MATGVTLTVIEKENIDRIRADGGGGKRDRQRWGWERQHSAIEVGAAGLNNVERRLLNEIRF